MRYLRVPSVAEKASVSESTVWRWVRSGQLHSVLVGGVRLIPEDAVDELIESAAKPDAEASR